MIIPHLMFAHMLADYTLQSNWLVARKGKSWDGLVLHGAVVGLMSLVALVRYIDVVWPALIVLAILHTFQDFLKIYSRPYLHIHPFIPYMGDQLLHYLTMIGIQLWVADRLSPTPQPLEIAFMWTGAAVIIVTRTYDITCWANWLDMIPYMNRWRLPGYAERIGVLAVAAAGFWPFAPLCLIPRLVISHREHVPIWHRRRAIFEMAAGAALSLVLGLGLHMVYLRI